MFVDFNILNQLGSPAINSNTFANRPSAGQTGRLFVSTDTYELYRDNGTTWDLIGGPGSSTITGSGTATQVAFFSSTSALTSSANLFFDNTNNRLGVGTAAPTHTIEANGDILAEAIYLDGATAGNGALYWTSDRVTVANYNSGGIVRIETNAGANAATFGSDLTATFVSGIGTKGYTGSTSYGGIFNGSIGVNTATPTVALDVVGKSLFTQTETYSSGNAIGVQVIENLTISSGTSVGLAAIGGVNSQLNLTLGGNATIANTGRQGLEGNTTITFSGAGTLTMTQGSTIRAFSALSSVYAFTGSAIGTITHLAGYRICFPDNTGSAVNITNNYALLINDQTTGTGTVTYTNRWGIYQEGSSDTNYFAATTLVGTTVNSGYKLEVSGSANATTLFQNGVQVLTTASISGTTNYIPKFTSSSAIGNSVIYESGGNVGIGTASPTLGKLQVNAGGNEVVGFFGSSGMTALQSNYLQIGKNQAVSNNAGEISFKYVGDNNAANMVSLGFYGNGQLLNVLPNGNVGIGTTSPSSIIEIQQATPILTLNQTTGNSNQGIYFNNSGTNYGRITNNAATGIMTFQNGLNSGDGYLMRFITDGSERMRITSGGLVNIFSTSTNTTFTSGGTLGIKTSNGDPYISWHANDGTRLGYLQMQANGVAGLNVEANQPFLIYTNATERMRITSGGNLLIGTTTDVGRLFQVNGGGIFTGTGYNTTNSAEIELNNTTATTGKQFILNSRNIGGFEIVDKTAGGASRLIITSTGNTELSGSIKTAAPSGGTAKPYKWGEAGVAISGSNSEAVKVEIDGTLYYLMTATPA